MRNPEISLFDYRLIRYSFARKPGVILKSARLMLDLSPRQVIQGNDDGLAITVRRYRAIEADMKGNKIDAFEWFRLCERFGLWCDCLSSGYSARNHLMRVTAEIERGEFRLPISTRLSARVAAFNAWATEEWNQSAHFRPGLRRAVDLSQSNASHYKMPAPSLT